MSDARRLSLFLVILLLACSSMPMVDATEDDARGVSAPLRVRDSMTNFSWGPSQGEQQPSNVSLIGEWDWSTHSNLAFDSASGLWSTSLDLLPGIYCYKFVIGANDYRFDPKNPERGYCEGIENSLLRVQNHTRSTFTVELDSTTGLPSRILLHAGSDGVSLLSGGPQFLEGYYPNVTTYNMTSEAWDLNLSMLPDGKHRIHVTGVDNDGESAEDLIIPFWTGREAGFRWDDALIYMIMTDRFVNGNQSNDPPPQPNIADGAEWLGGDFEGVIQMIDMGYFDDLGVKAIWLTPFNSAANRSGLAADDQHQVSSYHGYWPIKPREVDSRLGTSEELQALVEVAHARGIRVMGDFVLNHVHEDHTYVSDHPEWFNSGCICGTESCDWTTYRLDCQFRPYLPDVNWKNREASEQFIDDALWWVERFNLDGARIDAVKHVDDLAMRNFATQAERRFETGGVDLFLKGETAMGWAGHSLGDNADEYGTINQYLGDGGLDGQADFVLYHAVVDNVFVEGSMDYIHLDYWTARSQDQYLSGSTMVPFIGSHDVPRFTSRADPGTNDENNQWFEQGLPGQPGSEVPYLAARQAFAWLMFTPGAPMIWMGDEYGEYGGADPDNRHMWRHMSNWSHQEMDLRITLGEFGQLRTNLEPLRRGNYTSLHNSTDAIAFARETNNDSVIILMNRGNSAYNFNLDPSKLTGDWSVANHTDHLGGANLKSGAVSLPGHGIAVFSASAYSRENNETGNDTSGNDTESNSTEYERTPSPNTACHNVDEGIIQYGWNEVLDANGTAKHPQVSPFQEGDTISWSSSEITDANLNEYARLASYMMPIRDALLCNFSNMTFPEWQELTRLLTINSILSGSNSTNTVNGIYTYLSDGDDHAPKMKFLEEAELGLKCLAFIQLVSGTNGTELCGSSIRTPGLGIIYPPWHDPNLPGTEKCLHIEDLQWDYSHSNSNRDSVWDAGETILLLANLTNSCAAPVFDSGLKLSTSSPHITGPMGAYVWVQEVDGLGSQIFSWSLTASSLTPNETLVEGIIEAATKHCGQDHYNPCTSEHLSIQNKIGLPTVVVSPENSSSDNTTSQVTTNQTETNTTLTSDATGQSENTSDPIVDPMQDLLGQSCTCPDGTNGKIVGLSDDDGNADGCQCNLVSQENGGGLSQLRLGLFLMLATVAMLLIAAAIARRK